VTANVPTRSHRTGKERRDDVSFTWHDPSISDPLARWQPPEPPEPPLRAEQRLRWTSRAARRCSASSCLLAAMDALFVRFHNFILALVRGEDGVCGCTCGRWDPLVCFCVVASETNSTLIFLNFLWWLLLIWRRWAPNLQTQRAWILASCMTSHHEPPVFMSSCSAPDGHVQFGTLSGKVMLSVLT